MTKAEIISEIDAWIEEASWKIQPMTALQVCMMGCLNTSKGKSLEVCIGYDEFSGMQNVMQDASCAFRDLQQKVVDLKEQIETEKKGGSS